MSTQSALQCCLTFTLSYRHSHADGGVNHAGRQPARREASRSGTPLYSTRGARDRTSNLPVTSQPALPPEPHAAHHHPCSKSFKKSRDFKAMPFTVQNYQNDAECTHQKINVPDLHLFTKVINTQRTLHLHLEDTFIQSDNRKNYISPSVQ